MKSSAYLRLSVVIASAILIAFTVLYGLARLSTINASLITIAVSESPLSAPFYVAAKQGYFDPQCIKVEIQDVIGGDKSFDAVMSGQADLGTSSDSVIVFNSFKRHDFVNLATFGQSDNDVKFVTLSDSGIKDNRDLLNKKIGVTKNTSGEYFLSTFLSLGGLSVEQVEIIYLSPDQLPEALFSKKVDLIVPWEPFAFESYSRSPENVTILTSKNIYTLTFNLIADKNKLIKNHHAISCVLAGLNKANEFIALNPQAAQQIVLAKLQLQQSFIDWVWQDYVFSLSLNRALLVNLNSQAQWVMTNGLTAATQQPDFENYIEGELLYNISPYAVTLGKNANE